MAWIHGKKERIV